MAAFETCRSSLPSPFIYFLPFSFISLIAWYANIGQVSPHFHERLELLPWRTLSALDMPQDEYMIFLSSCHTMARLVADLIATLFVRRLAPTDQSSPRQRIIAISLTISHAASLKVHTVLSIVGQQESKAQCREAAQSILNIVGNVSLPDYHSLHPVSGTLCMLACQTLMEDLVAVKRVTAEQDHGGWTGSDEEQNRDAETTLRTIITGGIATMSILAMESPLMSEFPLLSFPFSLVANTDSDCLRRLSAQESSGSLRGSLTGSQLWAEFSSLVL
jgi:hypothetical protein